MAFHSDACSLTLHVKYCKMSKESYSTDKSGIRRQNTLFTCEDTNRSTHKNIAAESQTLQRIKRGQTSEQRTAARFVGN